MERDVCISDTPSQKEMDIDSHNGYIRSLRLNYQHDKCGTINTLTRDLAEFIEKDPKSQMKLSCFKCRKKFPIQEFVWAHTNKRVGT